MRTDLASTCAVLAIATVVIPACGEGAPSAAGSASSVSSTSNASSASSAGSGGGDMQLLGPPPSGQGLQFGTPAFEVPAGVEEQDCYFYKISDLAQASGLDPAKAINVHRIESQSARAPIISISFE